MSFLYRSSEQIVSVSVSFTQLI